MRDMLPLSSYSLLFLSALMLSKNPCFTTRFTDYSLDPPVLEVCYGTGVPDYMFCTVYRNCYFSPSYLHYFGRMN
jgi:hypothetical protein